MYKLLLVIVGLARSGKDSFADYLSSKFGFKKFVFSNVLRKLAFEKGIMPTKMNLAKLGDLLREKKGMDAVAVELLKEVEKSNAEKIVLSGARSREEFARVKRHYPEAKLIALIAPKEERFKRKSTEDPQDEPEFFLRDKIDAEKKGLNELIEMADYKINNNASIEKLFLEADELIAKIASQ